MGGGFNNESKKVRFGFGKNTGFQCILYIFKIGASKFLPNLEYLEAQFQNVMISLENVYVSQLTAFILA